MPKKYKFINHTADVGFQSFGSTLEEAFENAALAMFEIITDTSIIKPVGEVEIGITSEDEYSLLYDWLSELLTTHDIEGTVFNKFSVEKIEETNENLQLHGRAYGEKFDPARHKPRTQVKAVTYHEMEIKKGKGRYSVRVVLDI